MAIITEAVRDKEFSLKAGRDEFFLASTCEDEGEAINLLKAAVLSGFPAMVIPLPDGEWVVRVKKGR